MGIRHDVEEGLEKYEITKIDGQPTDEDLNKLTKELTNALGSVATELGGGEHGHVGLIVEATEYITFPAVESLMISLPIQKHTQRMLIPTQPENAEYETHLGVESWARRMIVNAIDHEWIAEMESETMRFNHRLPKELLAHLRSVGGTLDHMDITELFSNLQKAWDGIETPASYFARGDKYERQLEKAGQAKNPALRLAFALATFADSGEFEPALRDWDAKSATHKTFANFRVYMQQEFGKHHKQNKTTAKAAGHGIANNVTDKEVDHLDQIEAQAFVLAEFANSLNEQTTKQFKEMMELFKKTLETKDPPKPGNSGSGGGGGRKTKKTCPHCGLEVYRKPEKCFELEANADKRPAGWKSKKSN
eukprot:CCRYP_009530-RB/>CCRYP_009530-RB protein AED:0.38 eAED:0.39 QI:0/0/0/1/1/1/2/0/363